MAGSRVYHSQQHAGLGANDVILAIDPGERRIGLALAGGSARLARPYGTLAVDEQLWLRLAATCRQENVSRLVIGLPVPLRGGDSRQTSLARQFARLAARRLNLPTYLQDESLSSVAAEEEIKKRRPKGALHQVDALAAAYILTDYLALVSEVALSNQQRDY